MYFSNPELVLDYLDKLPGYPFDPEIDVAFVDELHSDFPAIDILEQIKAFRWHYDGNPASHFKSLRPALRRWLMGSKSHDQQKAPF